MTGTEEHTNPQAEVWPGSHRNPRGMNRRCTLVLNGLSWIRTRDIQNSRQRLVSVTTRRIGENAAGDTGGNNRTLGAPTNHIISMRSRWVGKSGRIRREGMGKRVTLGPVVAHSGGHNHECVLNGPKA